MDILFSICFSTEYHNSSGVDYVGMEDVYFEDNSLK